MVVKSQGGGLYSYVIVDEDGNEQPGYAQVLLRVRRVAEEKRAEAERQLTLDPNGSVLLTFDTYDGPVYLTVKRDTVVVVW